MWNGCQFGGYFQLSINLPAAVKTGNLTLHRPYSIVNYDDKTKKATG
jgi:hypothetical protein